MYVCLKHLKRARIYLSFAALADRPTASSVPLSVTTSKRSPSAVCRTSSTCAGQQKVCGSFKMPEARLLTATRRHYHHVVATNMHARGVPCAQCFLGCTAECLPLQTGVAATPPLLPRAMVSCSLCRQSASQQVTSLHRK